MYTYAYEYTCRMYMNIWYTYTYIHMYTYAYEYTCGMYMNIWYTYTYEYTRKLYLNIKIIALLRSDMSKYIHM